MKIKNKKDALVRGALIAGIMLILVGIIECIYSDSSVICFLMSDFVLFGLLSIAYGIYAANISEKELLPDERTKTNSNKAGFHTFWIILSSVGLMFLADVKGLYYLEVIDVLTVIIVIGLFSYFSLDFYYNKIGIRHLIRYSKKDKFFHYCLFIFGFSCLVGLIVIVSLPSIIPENIKNMGFVDDSSILKSDHNFTGDGINFTKYRDIDSAKHALMGGNIFLFFVVHEDYLETVIFPVS
ncbi:MAG: hypothetical protein ACT6FB_03545, partial [Methanosarcinaceae archaeon]